jgi:hypothetical protein
VVLSTAERSVSPISDRPATPTPEPKPPAPPLRDAPEPPTSSVEVHKVCNLYLLT